MQFGHLHILIVHFPIALGIAAAVADLLWLITRRAVFKDAGAYCLIAALVVTPLVVLTGSYLLEEKSSMFTGDTSDLAEDHETMGYVSLCVIVAAAAVRLIWREWRKKWMPFLYGALSAAIPVCVAITAHLGGTLVWTPDFFAKIFGW